jgi:2-oxo-4-hydroxy-4-carboxy--5-ureidoimidazoline (OHCU) decarboxylase
VAVSIPPARELSTLDAEGLERVLQPLFGHSTALAGAMAGMSFSTWDAVIETASNVIAGLAPEAQLALLRGHARLGENPEELKKSSQVSFREQQGAEGIAPADVRETLLARGECYERKFGFPFVEFVAGRPLDQIVPVLERRLENAPEVERATALRAIVAIADDRLEKMHISDGAGHSITTEREDGV